MLVPRQLVPAVRALEQEIAPSPGVDPSELDTDLDRLARRARRLMAQFPKAAVLSVFAGTADELRMARLDRDGAREVRPLINAIGTILDDLRAFPRDRPEPERAALSEKSAGEIASITRALQWQQPGESQKIGLSTLTANCLCKHHNSTCLSPLDMAAGQFFASIKSASSNESTQPISILVSGHDIERWMLKTLFALAHGKILARERQLLPKCFYQGIDESHLLTNPTAWPARAGLYSMRYVGQVITARNQLDMSPIAVSASDALIGLRFSILGLAFDFLADLLPNIEYAGTNALYRPERLTFRNGPIVNEVLISWIDGRDHPTVNFESTSPKQLPMTGMPCAPTNAKLPVLSFTPEDRARNSGCARAHGELCGTSFGSSLGATIPQQPGRFRRQRPLRWAPRIRALPSAGRVP
jgi:hypothetical protein